MPYCSHCEKHSFCKVPADYRPLCQNLEQYLAKTIDRKQTERISNRSFDRTIPRQFPATPSRTEQIISAYFIEHMRCTQIAITFDVSHQYVSAVIQSAKKKLHEKLKK